MATSAANTRKVAFAAQGGAVPEAESPLEAARPAGHRDERHRKRAEHERGPQAAAAAMQDRIAGPAALSVTANPEGYGNDGPTASACAGWKSGKPKPGFPLFHAAHATTTTSLSSNFKNQERKSAAARPPLPDFHDHLVLETNSSFRLILY